MITGHSKLLDPSLMPVDLKSGTTVKYCHTLPSSPFFENSSLRMASDSLTASSLSLVIAPVQRTPRPGPGNGCLSTMADGSPSALPTTLTSSLNRSLIGSTSSNWRSSGSPPTLWWALTLPLSRISG